MSYLKISSVGTMEPEALSLIGASTKRGDSTAIGMFGSGLKYSLASLLRQKINFKIFSGFTEYKIDTVPVKFGDQTFNKIRVNGKETSLTDSMGTEDWAGAWPYVREIYSNALDTNSATIKVVDEIDPVEGITSYYIEMYDDLRKLVANFEHYFLTPSKALYVDSTKNAIHSGVGKVRIYRKGILIYESNDKALFNYDLDNVGINESRVLRYTWSAKEKVGRMIEECNDSTIVGQFIGSLVGSNNGTYEQECILSSSDYSNPSRAFKDYARRGKFYPVEMASMLDVEDTTGRLCLPASILRRLLKAYPDADILGMSNGTSGVSDMYVLSKPTDTLKGKIAEAVALLKSTSYKERLTAPIEVVKFKSNTLLGQWRNKTILLSDKLDTVSVPKLATIIIEEQEHGITGFGDRTREFQTHLFELLGNVYGQTIHMNKLEEELKELRAKASPPTKWERIKNILFS